MAQFLDNLVAFARLLRRRGLPVDSGRVIDLAESLQHIDLSSRDDVRHACRSLLVSRHEDFPAFDQAFDVFFGRPQGEGAHPAPPAPLAPPAPPAPPAFDSPADGEATQESEAIGLRTWSDADTIASKDFAALSETEIALARAALVRLAWDTEPRRTRRWVPGRGSRIDLRRTLSRSIRTGGEILSLLRRHRRTRPRPIVLLCDVSGSMEPYSRTLLLFAHTLARRTRGVEAFLFATRLTRITMELRSAKPDAAMAAVSQAVRDWSGGTRIGDALRAFHQRWRRRTLHSDAIVVLISDGWDRGDPQLLRDEIARLQRSCHRLIWLNPLIGSADYAPLTRGLQAALPFVDDFLPVRTLRDVRDLALHLASITHGHHRQLHPRSPARTRLAADARSGGDRVVHPGM